FQNGANVLHKVKLFVGGGGPEILPVVGEIVALLLPFGVGEVHGAFFAEGGIRQDVIEAAAIVGDEGIAAGDRAGPIYFADVVQEHVHEAEAAGVGDDFVAGEGVVFEERLLLAV